MTRSCSSPGPAVHEVVEPVGAGSPADGDEGYGFFIARLETDGGRGGDVQTHSVSCVAIEFEGAVHFEEMKMGADLNGAVAGVTDFEGDGFAPRIEFNGIGTKEQAARPAFWSCSESCWSWENPPLVDGVVNGDEAAPVGEDGFHLHGGDHFDHTFHDVVAGEDFAGFGHDFFDGLPGAGFLKCGGGEHGHGLGMVELQAFGFPLERDISQGMNHELVELARSKVHMDLLCTVCNTHCMNVTRIFHDEYITS